MHLYADRTGRYLTRPLIVPRRFMATTCTYCHRQFGSTVTWRGKRTLLTRVREHIIPKAIGGRKTVPACQLCNQIKGSLVFRSLGEIQEHCLDALLRDGSVTNEQAPRLRSKIKAPPKPQVKHVTSTEWVTRYFAKCARREARRVATRDRERLRLATRKRTRASLRGAHRRLRCRGRCLFCPSEAK